MRKYRQTGLILLLFVLSFFGSSAAEGQLEITPHFDLEVDHYDNISFSAQSEIGDSYVLFIPGVSVDIPNRWLSIKLDYSYWRYQYRDLTELNRSFHKASLEINDNIPMLKNTTLALGDNYEIVPVSAFITSDIATNQVQKNVAYLKPVWEKNFSRQNALTVDYLFSRADYFGRGSRYGQNYFEHRFRAAVKNVINPWISFPLKLAYLIRDYDDLPEYRQLHPEAGISVSPYKYLTFNARMGYYLEDDNQRAGDNVSYHLDGSYKKTRNLVRLSYDRKQNFDIEGNAYREDHSELLYHYYLGKKLGFNGYLRYHRYSEAHPASERWEARFSVNYQLTGRSHLELGYVRYRSKYVGLEEGTSISNRFFSKIGISF